MQSNPEVKERIITQEAPKEEWAFELSLRPKTLPEFVGQKKLKENLEILMGAAKKRKEPIEHVLLSGNAGLGKCVTPDTIIFTDQGMLPIGSLGDLQKRGFQKKTAQLYGLHDAQATSHFYNNGKSETLKLKTHLGLELEGTPNHPIVVLEEDGIKFKQLNELKKGDTVAVGRGQNYFGKQTQLPRFTFGEGEANEETKKQEYPQAMPAIAASVSQTQIQQLYQQKEKSAATIAAQLECSPSTVYSLLRFYKIPRRSPNELCYEKTTVPQEMTPQLSRLCGYLIGDAYVGRMGEVAFSNEDDYILNDYQQIWQELFNHEVHVTKWREKCRVIRAKNKKIRDFFINIGIPYCTSHNKEIPWTILQAPKPIVVEFLRGYFECDGHIRPDCRQIDISSASKKLIQQLQVVLLNFGVVSRRYTDTHKKESRSYERLYITGEDVDSFKKEIGFISPRKRDGQVFPIKKNTNKNLIPFGKERIKEIKKTLLTLVPLLVKKQQKRTSEQLISQEAMAECLAHIRATIYKVAEEIEKAERLCNRQIFWDRVSGINKGLAQTVDVTIPSTHTFFGNGFINHNTTLAHIIAHEMGGTIRVTSGPTLERVGDLAAILTNLEDEDVLFIDEIHRLNKTIEETLYPAMEDRALDLIVGKGPTARTLRLNLSRFTVIGATTRMSLLSAPLRDRFGSTYNLNFYTEDDLAQIVIRSAKILKVKIHPEAAVLIAERARRTPRVANRLLKRVRDFAQMRGDGKVNSEIAEQALAHLEIDAVGLDESDRRILQAIIEKFGGGPVGLSALAAATSEEIATIEEIYEPYLLQLGLINRTPRGRVATPHAYKHLNLPSKQQGLTLNQG